MNERLPTVSVVICCYTEQRWHDLAEAVKSLAGQTSAPAEVLLVVDHNPALASRAAAAFDGGAVRVLASDGRQGLSGARNAGVRAATGEIVAFLDDDATADPGWLAELLAPYADPLVMAVGGKALPVWPDGAAPAWLPAELYWVVGCGFTGQPVELGEVRNLMGCAMSFRRDVVLSLGGFAEEIGRTAALPLGCEETELCIRLRQRLPGAKVILQPAATVRHRVTEERTGWAYLRRRSWSEGLSKAAISRMIGSQDALSTERSYVRSVIPRALLRSLGGAVRGAGSRRDAVAAGGGLLLATSAAGVGYLAGRVRSRRPAAPEFTPTRLCTVDLEVDRPDEVECAGDALVLVRSGRSVLGTVHKGQDERSLPADEIRELAGLRPVRPSPPAVLPRVSVVLATAGDSALLRRCVHSVLATGYPDLEVLVVDNVPGRARPELRELAASDERVHYLREPEPGASRARNLGARRATGTVLAFTDDDAVADAHWLTEGVAELAQPGTDCTTGLVMPMCLDTAAQVWFEEFGGFGKGYQRRVFGPETPGGAARYLLSPGVFGSGNNMMWSRDAYLSLGGLDERLGPGRRTRSGEDLDLFLRLLGSGGRLAYTPHALVWHEHRATEEELRRQLRGYGTGLAAMFLLYTRRPGGPAAIAGALPRGLRLFADPRSERNASRGRGYPRRLLVEELRGVAAAPAALLREVLQARGRGR
ncbi:glycosyltransferase family 2 protein [Amycolatopsis nigrescens]|uniref:glycosyltransferase family 2 protein n=1 Tax=Amycolatopsis nigrescens TaxID=381445 RepID=UPI00037C1A86|nr:glycosyltransferase family 2 protein [Amycolatopsis nigrescens]